MDAATVLRVMSLIPDRTPRVQSGSAFVPDETHPPRLALVQRFLHWLGPLAPLTKEDQQALGVRSSGGRSPEEPGDLADLDDELPEFEDDPDKTPLRIPEAAPAAVPEQPPASTFRNSVRSSPARSRSSGRAAPGRSSPLRAACRRRRSARPGGTRASCRRAARSPSRPPG
jgi:hypothetical protein